jgi:hypothetical protein
MQVSPIREIIAYPSPKVKRPTYAKVGNKGQEE